MRKKVLIVVDMQNDFVDGALGTPEAQSIIPNVIKKVQEYEDNEDLILFTKDTHNDDYLETFEGQRLPVPHCIIGMNGWEIINELKQFINPNKVIEKETFGFEWWSDEINSWLPYGSIDGLEIEIIGLCTDICVIANAIIIKTQFPETIIKVDASCCAGVTPEKHKAALEVMKSCQIEIVNE